MSDLLARLPGVIAAELKPLLPDLRECRAIAGRFNVERLRAERIAAPSVLVSLIGLRERDGFAGRVAQFDLSLAAFVVTKDQLGIGRDAAAAAITAHIAAHVPGRCWGEDALDEARGIEAQSIVTAEAEKSAASLWAVTWTQPCVLRGTAEPEPLDTAIYVSREPKIGADHEADYDRIGGDA